MDHAHELAAATARFAELLARTTGEERVPACEKWSTRDLGEHLGTIHRWAASILLSGQRLDEPQPLVTEPLHEWYSGTASALLAAVHAVSPEEPVPNFSRLDETAAFWSRRQMHETTVHVVDVAQSLGLDESEWAVPADVAADGVEEVLHVFFPRLTARGRRPDVRSRIRLVATDVDRSWIIGPGAGEGGTPLEVHPSLEADATVTGSAADLYLALWHRVDTSRLEVDGPAGAAMLEGPTTP